MSSNISNSHFVCENCAKKVSVFAPGTKNRNHCPFCLFSLHVDSYLSGDRASTCLGLMKPFGNIFKDNGEELLVHKCLKCGFIRWDRIAGDDIETSTLNLKILTKDDLL